ncbi:uncharacterized protein LOC128166076 [Crassostrea angulata]|uniref:uncharacterized protein LOC128166076 n=1 Tax=Magallana angulata TaxID=2784310 RepID=UPI0022B084B9|nr:uncharacterized protein LOC128166076 [Crassostrea angulata]
MSSCIESGDEVLSIMADSDNDSFEGFDSDAIREAEKRLAKKLNEVKAVTRANSATGSVSKDLNNNGNDQSECAPARPVASSKGTKRKKANGNKNKTKKTKKDDKLSGKDITNALVNMGQDEIDKFKEIMGINDLIGCIYNLQQDSASTNQSIEHESISSENENQNEFDFFADNESEKDIELSDWAIPDWFSSDKKGKDIDSKLAEMVNTLCIKEGETSKIIEDNPRPANCNNLVAPRVNTDIWNILPKFAQSRDSGFQAVQKTIVAGITPILRIAEMMKTNDKFKEIRNLLKQSIIVLCNSIYQISQKRRFLMRRVLPNRFQDICNTSQPVSELLFGGDIQKKIKELSDFDKYKRDRPRNNSFYTNTRGRKNYPYNYNYGRGRGSNRPFLGGRNAYGREMRNVDRRGKNRF